MCVPRCHGWTERFSCLYDQGLIGIWHFGLLVDYEKVLRRIYEYINIVDGSHFGRSQQDCRSPLSIVLYSHTLLIWSPKVLLAHMDAWDDIHQLIDEDEQERAKVMEEGQRGRIITIVQILLVSPVWHHEILMHFWRKLWWFSSSNCWM
jgi:hypothetical protein